MLAIAQNRETALELLRFVRVCMQERALSLNEKKTIFGLPFGSEWKERSAKGRTKFARTVREYVFDISFSDCRRKVKKGTGILEYEQLYGLTELDAKCIPYRVHAGGKRIYGIIRSC